MKSFDCASVSIRASVRMGLQMQAGRIARQSQPRAAQGCRLAWVGIPWWEAWFTGSSDGGLVRGALYQYLADDHIRLDLLLQRAVASPGVIDAAPYHEFRKGILRHISMEEKIVLPAIARWQGGRKAAIGERLRLDHGALVALLAPPPTPSIMLTIQSILEVHNELEEREGGFYELFEGLAGDETERMLAQLKSAPPVAVLPNNDKPEVLESAKKVVAMAGHEFKVAS